MNFSTSVTTNSYDASSGSNGSQSHGSNGYVGSNGNVTLHNSVVVNQNVYMDAVKTLTVNSGSTYGSRIATASSIVWPTPSAGSYATTNDNGSVGLPATGASASFTSGSFSVPPGHYYLNSFTMTGGTLSITGPTTIYMNGSVAISGGTINITSGHPGDLMFKTVIASSITISGGSDFYADVQAPTSTVTISGISNFYGRLIGSALSVTGTCGVHYDTSLPAVFGASMPTGGGSAGIQTVR